MIIQTLLITLFLALFLVALSYTKYVYMIEDMMALRGLGAIILIVLGYLLFAYGIDLESGTYTHTDSVEEINESSSPPGPYSSLNHVHTNSTIDKVYTTHSRQNASEIYIISIALILLGLYFMATLYSARKEKRE